MRFESTDVALVTGGGGGIGRAVCERLAALGVAVAALDINKEGADTTAARARRSGVAAISVECDISSRPDVASSVRRIESELGPISIAVNNAAICPTAPFLAQTDDMWQRVLSINLGGVFIVCQEVVRGMVERGHGRIVNVSSTSAHRGFENSASYAASKGGIEALSRALAFELGEQGVRINVVAPGPILTELNAAVLDDADRRERLLRMAVGRLGQPEDVAEAVCFLASLDASFIQGVSIPVEGGFLIGGVRGGTRVTAAPSR